MKNIVILMMGLPLAVLYSQEMSETRTDDAWLAGSGQDTVLLNMESSRNQNRHFEIKTESSGPFCKDKTITFVIARPAQVKITVNTLSGGDVKQLYQGKLSPGQYSTVWLGNDKKNRPVPSGVYCCTLEVNGIVYSTQCFALLR